MDNMDSLNVDEVYDIIGHLGLSQFLYFVSLSLVQFLTSHHMLVNIYAGLEPNFTCNIGGNLQASKPYFKECFKNNASKCYLEFDTSFSSIVSEWNLVCDEKYKVALVQSVWMGGVMAGALLLGGLADQIGRIKTILFSLMGLIIFESSASFAFSYLTFISLRFFGGMCCSLIILATFVLSQELIGATRRSICAITMPMFFSVGIAILSVTAAIITNWRTLSLFGSVYGIVFLLIPFFIPESPRWLVGQGRCEEAEEVLTSIAKRNGTVHLLPKTWKLSGGPKGHTKPQKLGAFVLFSHRYVLGITLIQIFSWFVNSAVYYALTMSAGDLQGNVYWATALNGLVEIPACISTIFLIDRYGRRITLCFFMVLGGTVCLLIPLVPASLVSTFALMGKLGITASFAVIYLHSGEIFPTVIRNTAMGVVSVAARIGGILSPFILMLGDFKPNLHFVVLGLMTLAAGLLNIRLPETLGRPTPETMADIFDMEDKTHAKQISKTARKGYTKLTQKADDEEGLLEASVEGKHTQI